MGPHCAVTGSPLPTGKAQTRMTTCACDWGLQGWLHLGLCLMSLGDLNESVASLTQAARLDPKMQDAWFGLVHCEKEVRPLGPCLGSRISTPGTPQLLLMS